MERAAHSPGPFPLSVEPVMLPKASRDQTLEDPQPSTSSSLFCIGSPNTSGPAATTACPASGGLSANALPKSCDNQLSVWNLITHPIF